MVSVSELIVDIWHSVTFRHKIVALVAEVYD